MYVRRVQLGGVAAAICGLLGSSVLAHAQDVVVPRDQRAREIFQEGREAVQAGNLRVAAARFERAFELSGRPVLLLNVASAFEALGDREGALAALQQYLLLEPESEQWSAVALRIQRLGGVVPRRGLAVRVRRNAAESHGDATDDGPDRLLTWIAAGLAGTALVIGGVLFVDAAARYQSLQASCGAIGCPDEEVDGVATRVTAAWALTGVAVASAALATVLFFVEGSEPSEGEGSSSDRALRVGVGPGALALSGSFP